MTLEKKQLQYTSEIGLTRRLRTEHAEQNQRQRKVMGKNKLQYGESFRPECCAMIVSYDIQTRNHEVLNRILHVYLNTPYALVRTFMS